MLFELAEYTQADQSTVQQLWRDYAETIGIDLSFQAFDEELASLPGRYAQSQGGGIWLAKSADHYAGCVALYRKQETPPIAEIKRLFVRPECQGQGLGKRLLVHAIEQARALGYVAVWLDSLARLEAANQLYQRLGFEQIDPYNDNPHGDVVYYGLSLS